MHSNQKPDPPNLEPTGSVHDGHGIIDNREARNAFDLLMMEDNTVRLLVRKWKNTE